MSRGRWGGSSHSIGYEVEARVAIYFLGKGSSWVQYYGSLYLGSDASATALRGSKKWNTSTYSSMGLRPLIVDTGLGVRRAAY